ncbi:NIPSNAP family protein [Methylobacterium mesophilicum SR1.6/6]|uniref:NIPSNAP family protein n=1 Tax=Methylobacterium mesophilicum SR1.6/6 TaxID=908290 RepID=A0A6B9FMY1_9HYPH|nr:NIPSNAP family protein [Methylobacterium mesophilicum]QGY02445.1 NIPSNAP family protein [Methylobacterium mesophilicum SR1.6/6]
MIVEMRVYYCAPTRLPALLERFRSTTLGFFQKYGIEQIGFWTTLVGPDNHALTYLLKWDDMAQREARWNAFQVDPDWIAARAETEKDRPIVARIENTFLAPTDFSALR